MKQNQNPKYNDYIIISSYNREYVVKTVKEYLAKGYEPLGSPFSLGTSSDMHQALILPIHEKEI